MRSRGGSRRGYLALHQPEQALAHAAKLEEMLGELQGDQADGLSLEQGRVVFKQKELTVNTMIVLLKINL